MGGAGKTPITLAIIELLCNKNINAQIVFKAYQAPVKQAIYVNENSKNAMDIGDEPCMVAHKGIPTWVGSSRFEAAMKAYQAGADTIVFDDGFQDLSVNIDIRGLIFDPLLNLCHVFPAGPLREPLNAALKRADVLFVDEKYTTHDLPQSKDIIYYKRVIDFETNFKKEAPTLAFCGIGNPKQFEEMLIANNTNLVEFLTFPDHHKYRPNDIENIIRIAKLKKLQVITTEKDIVKIPEKYASLIKIVSLRVNFVDQKKALKVFLRDKALKRP